MIDFAKFVKKLLIDKGILQGEFGAKLGLSKQDTSKFFKRADYRINADIARIADALGYDVQLILIDRATGERIECK